MVSDSVILWLHSVAQAESEGLASQFVVGGGEWHHHIPRFVSSDVTLLLPLSPPPQDLFGSVPPWSLPWLSPATCPTSLRKRATLPFTTALSSTKVRGLDMGMAFAAETLWRLCCVWWGVVFASVIATAGVCEVALRKKL